MKMVVAEEMGGEVFPSGRRTRILTGAGRLPVERFEMGHSTIFPNGSIPLHSHANEEVYVILSGTGDMRVGDETQRVGPTTAVYIPSNMEHSLTNVGTTDLILHWVYAPAGAVTHWAEEREGRLK